MKKNCSLIIGSTGLIGRGLIELLETESTYCISRSPKLTETDKYFNFDISDQKKLESIINLLANEYEEINAYYLAGESSVEASIVNPKESLLNSINPFIEFLDLMTKTNSKIVVASSGSVYDSRTSKDAYTETDSIYAPSPYAASKLTLESISQSFC